MTPVVETLVVCICAGLDAQAVTGEWPEQECRWCRGQSQGYAYSQEFQHDVACIVPLVIMLRETLRKEIEEC